MCSTSVEVHPETGADIDDLPSARGVHEPHPDRLAVDDACGRIVAAHAAAVEAGEPGHLDPGTGLFVLTAAELAARGTCCEQGCRHCPYC